MQAGDGAEQWELTCAAGLPDGHGDGPACAALHGCAAHGAVPLLSCEPGEAPGAEDTASIHGGGRHRADIAVVPADGVPSLGGVVEVAEQRDGSPGWLTELRIQGQQDGEGGLCGVCRQWGTDGVVAVPQPCSTELCPPRPWSVRMRDMVFHKGINVPIKVTVAS